MAAHGFARWFRKATLAESKSSADVSLVVMTGVYELAKVLELRSQDCVAAVYSGSDSSVGRLRFYAAAWHRPRE